MARVLQHAIKRETRPTGVQDFIDILPDTFYIRITVLSRIYDIPRATLKKLVRWESRGGLLVITRTHFIKILEKRVRICPICGFAYFDRRKKIDSNFCKEPDCSIAVQKARRSNTNRCEVCRDKIPKSRTLCKKCEAVMNCLSEFM